jgi:hypothetical protein
MIADSGKPVLADVFVFGRDADLDLCDELREEALHHTTDTDFVHALDAGFLVFGHFQMLGAPAAKVRIKHTIGLQNQQQLVEAAGGGGGLHAYTPVPVVSLEWRRAFAATRQTHGLFLAHDFERRTHTGGRCMSRIK